MNTTDTSDDASGRRDAIERKEEQVKDRTGHGQK